MEPRQRGSEEQHASGNGVALVPAIEYACDVEDIVVHVPHNPALYLPPSPPRLPPPLPSSSLPPPPSFIPLSSSLPSPLRMRVRRHPRPRQRTRFPSAPSTAEPRRNRRLTPFDRIVKIFTDIEKRRLDIEERRLEFEEDFERRRLDVDERRLLLEEENERRLHDRNIQMLEVARLNTQLMQTLADINQREVGSSHN